MGFGKKQWYLYAAAVPLTLLVMLSTSQMVRGLLLPAAFLTVLFYNVCQIAHVKTLDFGKLTGFVYFSGVITFCFLLAHPLKADAALRPEYRYDAIYFHPADPVLRLGRGHGGVLSRAARSAGTSWPPSSAPTRPWRALWAACWAAWPRAVC